METIMSFPNFEFQSFWHFLGTIILTGILCEMLLTLIRGRRR